MVSNPTCPLYVDLQSASDNMNLIYIYIKVKQLVEVLGLKRESDACKRFLVCTVQYIPMLRDRLTER